MLSGGAFILVLDFSPRVEKVPIPLATVFYSFFFMVSVITRSWASSAGGQDGNSSSMQIVLL